MVRDFIALGQSFPNNQCFHDWVEIIPSKDLAKVKGYVLVEDNTLGIPSLLHVMAILGHKDIKNVMLYVQVAETGSSDDFICEVAKTLQEATRLIEGGFEYVTGMEGVKLFRKRK
jgi:hypothetical protein